MTRRRYVLRSALVGAASLLGFGSKKLFDYSAAPDGEKKSDFVFPPRPDTENPPATPDVPVPASLKLLRSGGYTNDASHLNKTPVFGIAQPADEEAVRNALQFARDNRLKISPFGMQHSMGGQTFTPGGLLLDLRALHRITLDLKQKTVRAQAGARWWQIQNLLDQAGLAVKSMQSINIFSLGGSLSVNAHGIDPAPGPVAPTVRALRLMLSTGEVVRATPVENAELFRHALGGYGLFGVILDAELDVVDNAVYRRDTLYMDYKDFPSYYRRNVENNPRVGLSFSRLSVAPESYLRETAVHNYWTAEFNGSLPPLQPDRRETLERFIINFSKTGSFGRWTRWGLEKYAEPHLHACISRNQAMSGKAECLVSRNAEMYDDMAYLRNRLADTDILQEYFVPFDSMPDFTDSLRAIVERNGANLLNVTIRTVHHDTVTALPYAKCDMFGLVLYFNVGFNIRENDILRKTTSDLIDAAEHAGGTFYLPYRLYYSPAQLRRSYPEIDEFFCAKQKYDPVGLFSDEWYEQYSAAR